MTFDYSLRLDDKIQWAEVMTYSNSWNGPSDDQCKVKGLLAFSLFDFKGVSASKQTMINIRPGDHLAIIDCQSFVPDHIPVLVALELLQKQSQLPFKNGALLNLGRQDILPVEELEVLHKPPELENFRSQSSEISVMINEIIENSMLDPMIQLRRFGPSRELL
jgi:hypothetical protein